MPYTFLSHGDYLVIPSIIHVGKTSLSLHPEQAYAIVRARAMPSVLEPPTDAREVAEPRRTPPNSIIKTRAYACHDL